MPGVECILGYRGSGKSTLARSLCADDTRLVVCDTIAEYSRVLHWVPEVEAASLRKTVLSGMPFRAAFVPANIEEVQWLEKLVASQHDITLLIDEIDVWYEGVTGRLGEGLSWIAKTGRHYNQRVVAVARLASRMPIELRSEGCLWVFPCRHRGTRSLVQDSTDMGFDPIELRVLESRGDHVYRTEVARIVGARLQILEFDIRTGKLYERTATCSTSNEKSATSPDDSDDADNTADDAEAILPAETNDESTDTAPA